MAEVDRLRRQQLERAQYEADQARVRFMRVDPNNRLVADTLEGLWNEKLRNLAQVKEDYEKKRQADQQPLTSEQQQQILALAQDVPKLWNDPKTSYRDRKRMARLLMEDVALKREGATITAQVRFEGGATRVLSSLPVPLTVGELRRTKPEAVAEIDHLLDSMTDSEVASELNRHGWYRSVNHDPFTARAFCAPAARRTTRWTGRKKAAFDVLAWWPARPDPMSRSSGFYVCCTGGLRPGNNRRKLRLRSNGRPKRSPFSFPARQTGHAGLRRLHRRNDFGKNRI